MAKVYVIMGVSGSGKTTVGKSLAHILGLPFYDADDFHPQENIEKMSKGIPLTDEDREPWLKSLNVAISNWGQGAVLACSALKESYRTQLRNGNPVQFVFLEGKYDLIVERMKARKHFMKPEMLQSQFSDLEPPKEAITVSIDQPVRNIVEDILDAIENQSVATFGIVGMGVMGRSLAANALSKNHTISVYNRLAPGEESIIPDFIESQKSDKLQGFTDIESFIDTLKSPRIILMMIPSGAPVDEMIASLLPFLDPGDLLIDGGNANYRDTQRREQQLFQRYIHYLGMGISGGEKGALEGPSMMVGGSKEAYRFVQPLLESLAAKGIEGRPCVAYFGKNGAGHFIKTVHNGIEYGEMQLLAEIHALLSPSLSSEEIHALLSEWNEGELSSFLLETTLRILKTKEGDDLLLEKVLDVAKGKGTGTWTSLMALEWGIPTPLLTEAVMARSISHFKEQRVHWQQQLELESFDVTINTHRLKLAYTFARNINLLQGLMLLQKGSEKEHWEIDLREVIRVWTNGCILRSKLLEEWHSHLKENASLWNLNAVFKLLHELEASVSEVLLEAAQQRTALPCFSAALHFWFGITTANSSANLIQAQRDAFGAHTFQRIDKDSDQNFTSQWMNNG